MTWREQLTKPSFRGVPFETQVAGQDGGRRLHVLEFPRSDKHAVEDLGKRAKRHTVEAYVHGDNYMADRDRLVAALDQRGPGELVHPYLGPMTVRVDRYRMFEASRDGGMARFLMTFIVIPDAPGLVSEDDPAAALSAAADDVTAKAGDQLAEDLAVDGVPEFAREAGADQVSDLGLLIDKLGVFSETAEEIAAQSQRVQHLIQDASSLITSPVEVRDAVVDAIAGIGGSLTNAAGALSSYERIFNLAPHSRRNTSGTSALGLKAAANAQAVVTLARQVAVAEAAKASAVAPWETYEDALAARESILDEIDALADLASDEAFAALQALRAGLVGSVPPEPESLPRLGSLTLAEPAPSLVLSYGLYGSTDRAAELVARNRVQHPGFVPAGVALGVLVDV